jgi:hypothetical protein
MARRAQTRKKQRKPRPAVAADITSQKEGVGVAPKLERMQWRDEREAKQEADMALPRCPKCGSYDLDLLQDLDDGTKQLKCAECGDEWTRGDDRVLAGLSARSPQPAKRY